MSLNKILKQPFPYDPCTRDRVGMAAFFGSFIFGFLMIFKPFELDQFTSQRLLIIALVYGLITFSCVLVATIVLPFFFPETFNESVWTTGKQILLIAGIIVFVGLVNYLVSPFLVDTSLDFKKAIWFQGITLAVGLLPVSLFILLKQNRLLKEYSRQAQQIEKKLHEKQETNQDIESQINNILSTRISLIGEYQNEIVEVYPDDLYVVTSASNYIKIFHLQKEKLVYSIIRLTLKKAEEIILEHPNFFKCHRAFIINLDKVIHVEGNAQGYKVRIENHDELIPVSRNLNSEFSDKLLAFRKENSQ